MPRGAPDYGNVISSSPLHRLDDMAELAVRLGSANVYDRGGYIIYQTNFSQGVKGWVVASENDKGSAIASTDLGYYGPFCYKLSTSSDSPYDINVTRYLAGLQKGKMGMEVTFAFDPTLAKILFLFSHYDGVDRNIAGVRYDHENEALEYYTTNGAYGSVDDDFVLQHISNAPHTLKFVIDEETGTYDRILVDATEFMDLEYVYRKYERTETPYMMTSIQITCQDELGVETLIDNVIVTQGEP